MNFKKDKEKGFLFHSLSVTLFSPLASLYQTSTLFNKPFLPNLKFVPRIFPQQIGLRYGQIYLSTECKNYLSPTCAFGLIGVLQGIVYGHSNLYFSQKMNIIRDVKITNYLKGPVFAASRDIISQGIPFLFNNYIEDLVFGNNNNNNNNNKNNKNKITYYSSLSFLSISSTVLSHPFHCLQTYIQTQNNMSQYQAIKYLIQKERYNLFYKGIRGRFILLFITNLANDFFLNQLWH